MTIRHHPSDELLLGYSAGTLDQGQHIAIATHMMLCAACRGWVRDMEGLGGSVLEALPPSTMAADALSRIESLLDQPEPEPVRTLRGQVYCDMPQLPPYVRRLPAGEWTRLSPAMQVRRLSLPQPSETRVFLLRSKPGVKIMPHDHTGFEMTCILTGSFSHDGARYGPGDFDFGDASTSHEIATGTEDVCTTLVAMQGELRLKGLFGRLVQPFITL